MPAKYLWGVWGLLAITLSGVLLLSIVGDSAVVADLPPADKKIFLPHSSTDGHYQIEERCEVCHTPFQGVNQSACLDCHQAELDLAMDTHATGKILKAKPSDLAVMDIGSCVTCHAEHQPGSPQMGGVTVSDKFCKSCHARKTVTSATHVGLTFDMCMGCHNYHDNTALDPVFRKLHSAADDVLSEARVLVRVFPNASDIESSADFQAAGANVADVPTHVASPPEVSQQWGKTLHARSGVNCMSCHQDESATAGTHEWNPHPAQAICQECHVREADEFLKSRKGMRLAQDLSPMIPGQSRLPMQHEAHDRKMVCTACHAPHAQDTPEIAVDTCLGCHDSQHTQAYQESPHYQLWLQEMNGTAPPGSGVSCASCHMPRVAEKDGVHVVHNPNSNLRPNEKMVQSVCMNCHSVKFSLQALTDRRQVQENFQGAPVARKFSIDRWLEMHGSLLAP